MSTKNTFIFSISLIIGLLLLGRSLERFKNEDRYVTVKGFSEREIKSDLAIWTINISIPDNSLNEGSVMMEQAANKTIQFLLKNGLPQNDIIQKDLQIVDRQTNPYQSKDENSSLRFIINKTIQVRSANVDTVQRANRKIDDLVKSGVMQTNGMQFIFTGLNKIKPEMLAEATRNARNAAAEFTRQSNTKLGKLRKANQGFFSIVDRDEGAAGQPDGSYYNSGVSDVYKKVRVVISVDYFIN